MPQIDSAKALADHPLKDRFLSSGCALNRVLQEAPYLPRCSYNKTATKVKPREYALRYPYMQINRSDMTSWLIFDLDHANSLIWDDVGLPPPNFIVRNRESGRSHLYYAIEPVCTSYMARSKPIRYMKAIYQAFALLLKADLQYSSGPVAKTPGHPWWATEVLHDYEYALGDLADCVELEVAKPWAKSPDFAAVSHSRHCTLFEDMRFFAYSIVNHERDHGSYDSFYYRLEAYAHNANTYGRQGFSDGNLPYSSLRATVKSIARWTWDRYYGNTRCHRGAMQLDNSLPLPERQRLAAKRTHNLRHKETESKIRAACRYLLSRGETLLQKTIALVAKVSRQTVANYKHVIEDAKLPAPVALLRPPAAAPGEVNYGEHQVVASLAVAPLGDAPGLQVPDPGDTS